MLQFNRAIARWPGPGFHRRARPVGSSLILIAVLSLVPRGPAMAVTLRNVKPGDPVPAFTCRGADGKQFKKADYTGRILVLVFARPEQPESLKALRTAQKLLADHPGSALSVLGIATQAGGAERLRRAAGDVPFTYPIADDADRRTYGAFGVIVAPTTLLIDGTGVLRFILPHIPPDYERKLRAPTDLMLGNISPNEHAAALKGDREPISREQARTARRLALARKMAARGDYQTAITILEKTTPGDDQRAAVAALLGACYLENDQVEAAAKCLAPLADLKPAPRGLALALARLAVRRGNDAEAERRLLEALKTCPDPGPILFELGRLYERAGKTEQALKHYREALEHVYGRSYKAFSERRTSPP